MTSDLFQNISGQWVAANLPVPVLAEPTKGRLSPGSDEVRESTPNGTDQRRIAKVSDSRGGQSPFAGESYVPELDRTRLQAQLTRIRELMRDGKKRSLAEIAAITGDPEASISARLRQLRQPKNGLWTVNRQRRSPATFEYWLGGKGL